MRGIVTMLLLIMLLTGCAAPSEEAAPGAAAPAAPETALQAENMQASLVESASRPLLESEVLAAYERALRVYGWFDLTPLSSSDETVVLDYETYYRVNANGIEDLEDLQAYLRSVFSRELAERLLDGETARIRYREVDGALYVCGSRRDRDADVGGIRVETEQEDEASYSVNVLVDLLDVDGETVIGQESWSFPYTFIEDRWVFTDFRLVY